ncbi:MAG: GNAT family N-acetyltransferase [Acidimicrobiia bacterium]|nr:GNAT family N-acetyltransferase [Acidimicrobiia bacterium]
MTSPAETSLERLPERIVGPRVELRIWHPAWADELSTAILNSLDELRPFMPWAAEEPLSSEARREIMTARREEWREGGDGFYTIFLDGRVIGNCGLHHRAGPGLLEIGYWIDSDHTGRGYATEAAELLRAAALAHPGIDHAIIRHDRANPASGRVAARAGFVFAAERPADQVPGGDRIEWLWRSMSLPGFAVRPERPRDVEAIATVVEAAFGSPVEAGLVADIRASPRYLPDLALVAEIDDPATPEGRRVVGHVMISGCALRTGDGTERPIVMLSPLAVAPDVQRHGVGAALVRRVVDGAAAVGEPLVVLEGNPAYYRRFGFEPADRYGIKLLLPDWAPPEAGQVLLLSNHEPGLTGTVIYPPAFDGLE